MAAAIVALAIPAAQAQPDATLTVQQVAPIQNFTVPQTQSAPDGSASLDSAIDKPHAGTPLASGNTATAPTNPPAQPYQTPDWYKDTPQRYDHEQAHRHSRAAGQAQARAQVKRRYAQPSEEIAAAPQQPMPQQQELPQDDSGQSPAYAVPGPQMYQQPAPRYYPPAPQQQAPQYYAQPQQGYQQAQPDYSPQSPQDGQDTNDPGEPGPTPTAQPLGAAQLEQLVAPIALYPDTLVAQVLTAATYPAQVSAAAQWVRSMQGAGQDQIAAGANAQQWDPSVKALTAFPQVLDTLAGNLGWTTALGNAYYNQPQDVMDTIQVMRQRADQAGNLESTPQEQVQEDQGNIEIAPANPEQVYLPTYNPWVVYGAPVPAYPGFSYWDGLGGYVGGGVQFGLCFGMGPFLHTPFGLMAWGLDWMGHSILFNHGPYWTHSRQMRDWGFAHGGPRWGGREWVRSGTGGRFGGYGNRFAENYRHEPLAIHGGEYGRGAFGGNAYAPRGGNEGRGYGNGFARGDEYARGGYGRMPAPVRPPAFAGRAPGYGGWEGGSRQFAQNNGGERAFGGFARPGQGNMGRPGGYGAPPSFHAPAPQVPRGGYESPRPFEGRSGGFERGYSGGFAQAPRSGGMHFYDGGHSSPGFGGHEPRGFSGGHSFGGGHGGGGHSGGYGGGHRR